MDMSENLQRSLAEYKNMSITNFAILDDQRGNGEKFCTWIATLGGVDNRIIRRNSLNSRTIWITLKKKELRALREYLNTRTDLD